MKKIEKFMGAILLLLLMQLHTTAQNSITQFLSINNNAVEIRNLELVDSAVGTKVAHKAAFDINASTAKIAMGILAALQDSRKNNKITDLLFTKINSQTGKPTEERLYKESIVKAIRLPELNATSKDAFIIRISLEATSVVISYTSANALNFDKTSSTRALKSNYSLEIDPLPCRRVSKISAMEITTNSKNGAGEIFEIELVGTDERAWNEVYSGGAGKILSKGKIELLSPSLKEVLLTIYLEDLKIVSYRTVAGTGQSISKVSYGIQVGAVSLSMK